MLASPSFAGGETCGTVGGTSFCAQLGKNGFADHLTFRNTGKGVISSFLLTFPPGTTVTGVAGNAGCHQAENTVACTSETKAGGSQTVDALANVGVGAKATLTASSGTAKASVVLDVQATAEGTQTTETPPSAGCEAKLVVRKSFGGGKNLGGDEYVASAHSDASYSIFVKNASGCTAQNVVAADTLPLEFTCSSTETNGHGKSACPAGRSLRFALGDMAPHTTHVITVEGSFATPRASATSYTVSNIALAKADNAGEETTRPVHVQVKRPGT